MISSKNLLNMILTEAVEEIEKAKFEEQKYQRINKREYQPPRIYKLKLIEHPDGTRYWEE